MPTLAPRIDAYMAAAPAFARPILQRLREDVHAACPDAVETIKWSRPHFLLDGKLLCGMSAFKAHCAFSFWEREGASPRPWPTCPAAPSCASRFRRPPRC